MRSQKILTLSIGSAAATLVLALALTGTSGATPGYPPNTIATTTTTTPPTTTTTAPATTTTTTPATTTTTAPATTTTVPSGNPTVVVAIKGTAVPGLTKVLSLLGSGFHGKPKITSNLKGTIVTVSKDSNGVLTIHIKTPIGARPGRHTLTIRFADGQVIHKTYVVA